MTKNTLMNISRPAGAGLAVVTLVEVVNIISLFDVFDILKQHKFQTLLVELSCGGISFDF